MTQQMQQLQMHSQPPQQYQYGGYNPNVPQQQQQQMVPIATTQTMPIAMARPPMSPRLTQPRPTAQDDDFFGEFSAQSSTPSKPPSSVNKSSHISVASSLGSRSTRSNRSSKSILDDKTFAPPPKYPANLQVLKNQFLSEGKSIASTLPSFEKVKHSGELLARFSLKSMLIKKWRPCFWIAYGDNQLLFFRNKNDFEEWASNPYLQKTERDNLVKISVDFVNDMYMPNVSGYRATGIRMKVYSRDGNIHHFKLEKWHSYGPSITAAFGGKNENEVRCLRTIINEMIRKSPQSVKPVENSDAGSSYRGSDVAYDSDYTNQTGRSGKSSRSGIWSQYRKESSVINGKYDENDTRSRDEENSSRLGSFSFRRSRSKSKEPGQEPQKSNMLSLRRNQSRRGASHDEDEDRNHGPAPLGTGY